MSKTYQDRDQNQDQTTAVSETGGPNEPSGWSRYHINGARQATYTYYNATALQL